MHTTATDIYKSILYYAADIYGIDYGDVERDVAQQFDPIVRFMSGAMASELERVYQQIHDTDSRLQKRLAQVLLPEQLHLPRPAHALAYVQSSSDPLWIDERAEFRLDVDEEQKDISFSPIFESQLLPIQIKWLATDTQLRAVNKKARRVRQKKGSEPISTRRIAIGFSASVPITSWKEVSLYFDLKPLGKMRADRDLLFAALPNTKCRIGDQALSCFQGLPDYEHVLEDYLNSVKSLEQIIKTRYDRHFLTFADEDTPEPSQTVVKDFLTSWFETSLAKEEDVQQQISLLGDQAEDELYWLEIELAQPIQAQQLGARLQVEFNVFPVVNRRLSGHKKGAHHYLRNNSIKWVSLQPEEDFMGIRQVYEDKGPDYQPFIFKPFAEFREDRVPSFTLRYGGIGRWDDFNAWQRLSYLVNILEDNYKQQELIEQTAKALSLEDIHHLLGNKIAQTNQEQQPTRDIYVLLHTGISTGLRVRVEYWTSVGAAANGLPVKAKLRCVSKHKSDIVSLHLINPPEGGRNPLNASEQLDAMKEILLSRGRIVTREDVKIFCKNFLGEKQDSIEVVDSVGIDKRQHFGMTRILEVRIKAAREANKEDWTGICNQIERLLNQKSSSSIPFTVKMID